MKSGTKIIGLVVCVAAIGGGAAFVHKERADRHAAREANPPVLITRGDLRVDILATGKIQPENRLEIKAPIAGRIESVKINEGDPVAKGAVIATMSSTDRAALLDLARARGKKAVSKLEDVFRETPLIAPLGGVIIAKNVEPGQTVTTADVAFVLSDRPIVVAQVDETDLRRIKIGQGADITLDAYPEDPVAGTVSQIAFEARTVNNVTVYDVKIVPKAVPGFMLSGMTANVKFLTEERHGAVLVPLAFTKQDKGSTVVMLPGGEMRPVKLGLSDGRMAEVLDGLRDGESIVDLTKQNERGDDKKGGSNPFMPFGNKRPGGAGGAAGGRRGGPP